MRRIIAMAGVCLLVALYIITLLTAILDSSFTMGFFWASVAATILIPLLLWIMIRVYEMQHRDEIELKKILNSKSSAKQDPIDKKN